MKDRYRQERRRSFVGPVIWFLTFHEVFFVIGVMKAIDGIQRWFGPGAGPTY